MKKKPMILIAAGVAGLLLAGGGGFFAFRAFSGGKKTEEKAEAKGDEKKGHGEEKKEGKEEGKHGAKEAKGEEKGEKGHGAASGTSGMGPVFAMEPFTVNLADQGRPRYLKLVLQAEMETPAALEQLEGVKPKVRDSVLMLLSSKTAAEVTSVEGKETLRNEIIRRLNSFVTQGKVTEVYFTDLVVQ